MRIWSRSRPCIAPSPCDCRRSSSSPAAWGFAGGPRWALLGFNKLAAWQVLDERISRSGFRGPSRVVARAAVLGGGGGGGGGGGLRERRLLRLYGRLKAAPGKRGCDEHHGEGRRGRRDEHRAWGRRRGGYDGYRGCDAPDFDGGAGRSRQAVHPSAEAFGDGGCAAPPRWASAAPLHRHGEHASGDGSAHVAVGARVEGAESTDPNLHVEGVHPGERWRGSRQHPGVARHLHRDACCHARRLVG
jgi:hypothetical protein